MAKRNVSKKTSRTSRKIKTDETTVETLIAIAVVLGLFILVGVLDVGQVVSEEIEIELAPAVTEIMVVEEEPEIEEASEVLVSGTTLGSSSSSFDVM